MSAPTTAADPTSVVGRRIVAFVIDLIMVWAIAIVLGLVLAEDTSPNDDSLDFVVEGGDAVVLYLVVGVYQVMTAVLQQALTGATPGKLIAGVRTVKADGSAPGILRALLRWVLLIVDAGLCFLPGLILVGVTKKHQRLGDLAASTYVVGSDWMGHPVDGGAAPVADWTEPQWGAQPAATDQWGGGWASPGAVGGSPAGQDAGWGQPAEQQTPATPAWGQPEPETPATPAWGQPAEQQTPAAPAWGQPEPETPATPAWGQPAEQQTPAAPAWGQPEPESPAAPAWGQSTEPQPAEAPAWGQPAAREESAQPQQVGSSGQTWVPEQGTYAADERTEAHAAVSDGGTTEQADAAPNYAPQWDADRQAYIQWDPSGRRWMQWDQANQRWFPIS